MTAKLQRHADVWRNISALSDQATADLIRKDQIDILVDLSLHSAGNRMLMFARKPAPIQVTWLGYPGTTGLEAIDYRLTDPRLDPPDLGNIQTEESGTASEARYAHAQSAVSSDVQDTADSAIRIAPLAVPLDVGAPGNPGTKEPYYSERSVRLPDGFWCYDPNALEEPKAEFLPGPVPMPALTAGYVTFGSLNNFCKVTDPTLKLWGRVLAAVPTARLIMVAPIGPARARVLKKLGVADPQRVEFMVFQPRLQYLETYHRIDLCLDTLPFNGGTTGLDALWMGVPILTRVGRTIVGRAGWSHLHNLGMTELVAHSDDYFVKMAVELAGDLERLGKLRLMLRQRMEQSPLMDAARFAGNVEAAYRRMWQAWCESPR